MPRFYYDFRLNLIKTRIPFIPLTRSNTLDVDFNYIIVFESTKKADAPSGSALAESGVKLTLDV